MNDIVDQQTFGAVLEVGAKAATAPPTPAAEFETVSKTYVMDRIEVAALKSVSGRVERGATTFVTGPSGSGKSTLLNMLGLIDRPTSGRICLMGKDITDLSDGATADFRSQYVGFVFQSFNLIPVLSVRENVEFPLLRHVRRAGERRRRAEIYLEAVGLADMADRRPGEVSGGQRQRVAIARALVTEPSIIVADEPTANLDSRTSREIVSLLDRMRTTFDTSVVICTHDTDLIDPTAANIRIVDGRLSGPEKAQ